VHDSILRGEKFSETWYLNSQVVADAMLAATIREVGSERWGRAVS